jgi:hypothetical protein
MNEQTAMGVHVAEIFQNAERYCACRPHSELDVCKTAMSSVPASVSFLSNAWRVALHKPCCMRTCQLLGRTAVAVPIGLWVYPERCSTIPAEVKCVMGAA